MPSRGLLDPKGQVHVPIGIANAVDTLKTFVEAEGSFSPGFATYGIYFWLYDPTAKKLTAPTMHDVACQRGLLGTGYLMPWSKWSAGDVTVKSEVCQVERDSPAGKVQVVAAVVTVDNDGTKLAKLSLYAALRPLGAAGGPVRRLAVSPGGDALLVDGHPALVADADTKPSGAGVQAEDMVGEAALRGEMPTDQEAQSAAGNCSGALRFDLEVPASQSVRLGVICPVLPGRRAVGHDWDGTSDWAQLDLARPNPAEGGQLQPDPGLEYYRRLKAGQLFEEATAYWKQLAGRVRLTLPDPRWAECFSAIVGHAAMEMNEGAPDVAVINYNVFNRDGVYVANIFQKSGNNELAAAAIDYFLAHPFNGRTRVEVDNPGQILWVMGEYWRFSRDKAWLERVYPSAAKIAAMIRYYRTTPGPHYVKATSLDFGDKLPPDQSGERPAHRRQVLVPGSCDGRHPEYTEAFDIAGLYAAAMLAKAAGEDTDAVEWRKLAAALMEEYDKQFGQTLAKGYGSFAVLWPCRLYPLDQKKAHEQFRAFGPTNPGGWRYFALAKAHQGLLAGNRAAGHVTIDNHLAHPQMKGWYVFDEGGRSGSGGWRFARTTWNGDVAMPHGWAIAEMWLLLRDCLAFEHGERLVLLPGIPPEWFKQSLAIENLPTYFGPLGIRIKAEGPSATLAFTGKAAPPGGFLLRLPPSLGIKARGDGVDLPATTSGDVAIPSGTKMVLLTWSGT